MTPPPATDAITDINTTWAVLHAALTQRRAVRARYHDHLRILCPHALGWKNGRAKALVYQTAIIEPPPTHDPHGWRSLFIDDIHEATITDDHWHTAGNYTPHTTGIDTLADAIP
jgi:hypothetical protein